MTHDGTEPQPNFVGGSETASADDASHSGSETPPPLNIDIESAIRALAPGTRIENAIAQLSQATFSVSFAENFAPRLGEIQERVGNNPVHSGLDQIVLSVLQKAVIDTAATFDETGPGTNSIVTALNVVKTRIELLPQSKERKAALALNKEVRARAVKDKTPEMAYVQYMRNKWAAHATLDRSAEAWAPGLEVNFTKLEKVISHMQSSFHDLVTLIGLVSSLKGLEQEARRIDESTTRMGISWEAFTSTVVVLREHGANSARMLLERIEPGLSTRS